MARCCFILTVEMDLCRDAVAEIARAHSALTHRHGAEFRILERRIEDVVEAGDFSEMRVHMLPEGFAIVEPPAVLKELLADIKRLGV